MRTTKWRPPATSRFPHYMYYQVASSEATTPTTCFPHCMCTTSCQFSSQKLLSALHLCYQVASSEATAFRGARDQKPPALHLYYQVALPCQGLLPTLHLLSYKLPLLRDTLVVHSSGHSCMTLLWDTFVKGHLGHSCRTLSWDTLVGGTPL